MANPLCPYCGEMAILVTAGMACQHRKDRPNINRRFRLTPLAADLTLRYNTETTTFQGGTYHLLLTAHRKLQGYTIDHETYIGRDIGCEG